VDVARLRGRRVLVTGASSGIGWATCRRLAEEGAQVAGLARREAALEELAAETGVVPAPADVTDADAAAAAVARAAGALGGLDAVVNAAGLVRPGPIADADPGDWRDMFGVNVLGLLHVTKAAVPFLRAAGRGDVVNLSSMSGRRLHSPELGVYAASKASVHALSEALRRELLGDRVRVSVLAPGLVDTPIFDGLEDETATRLREQAPAAGLRADDVARTVADVLAAPEHLVHVEVAMLSLDQG
jgi:NADP-dependent 3-hydroxy acid dehydrogenase YdfG